MTVIVSSKYSYKQSLFSESLVLDREIFIIVGSGGPTKGTTEGCPRNSSSGVVGPVKLDTKPEVMDVQKIIIIN